MTDTSDIFIFYLRRHLEVLDVEIADIRVRIERSNDPEGDGHYDIAEYFIGAGFVAMQKYMMETICLSRLDQRKALSGGAKLTRNVSLADAIWSAANYWKHDAEWWNGAIEVGLPDSSEMNPIEVSWPVGGKSKHNVPILEEFGEFGHSYICSNILAKLVGDTEGVELKAVLPLLEDWRLSLE